MPTTSVSPAPEVSLTLDLTGERGAGPGVKELTADLPRPSTRLSVAVRGGALGRAEALIGDSSWGAAHYWTEPGGPRDGGADTVTFEWSEALPAGPVRLRLPYRR